MITDRVKYLRETAVGQPSQEKEALRNIADELEALLKKRDQLETRAGKLEEALKSQPCGCTCDYRKAAEARIAAEKRGLGDSVACGDLPNNFHPNRVWCVRCAALTENVEALNAQN